MSCPGPEAELDALVEFCLRLAADRLARGGELLPFAVTVRAGSLQVVSAQPEMEFPGSTDVLALLADGLRRAATAGEIDGSAIAADAHLMADGRRLDALRLAVEHRQRGPLTVVVPYRRHQAGVDFADPLVEAGEPQVFG